MWKAVNCETRGLMVCVCGGGCAYTSSQGVTLQKFYSYSSVDVHEVLTESND